MKGHATSFLPRDVSELHRTLLAAMAAQPTSTQLERVAQLHEADHRRFLDLAIHNRVAPIAAHALMRHHSGSSAREAADRLHRDSMTRMQVLLGELDSIATELARSGIPLVALKNGGIARGIFPCRGCCPMGDLDVLVDRNQFRTAHEILLDLGYALETRGTVEAADLEEGINSGGTEYIKQVDGHDVWFELQWRPIAGRWIRPDQEPRAADLIERSVPAPGSPAVRLLDAVDNMLQVCLHTAKHSFVRAPGLRLHTDVDRIATFTPPDWDQVVALAQALNVTTAVYLSLSLSDELLGAPVPRDVLDRLRPPTWKARTLARAIRNAGVFDPDETKFSRPGMMGFHALLYDDVRDFAASALDTDRSRLGLRYAPENAASGFRRIKDLAVRYQR
jgi:hypothetical protein